MKAEMHKNELAKTRYPQTQSYFTAMADVDWEALFDDFESKQNEPYLEEIEYSLEN